MRPHFYYSFLIALLILFFNQATLAENTNKNIVQFINSNGNLSFFAKSIKKSGFDKQLNLDEKFTMIVSPDDAFDKVSFAAKFAVWSDKDWMLEVLKYHVIPGQYSMAELVQQGEFVT